MKYTLCYDLETTGLKAEECEIVQFSAQLIDSEMQVVKEFNIFHATPVSDFLLELHGKTQAFYDTNGVDKQTFINQVLAVFFNHEITTLMGHNIINFDNKWLEYHLGIDTTKYINIDTMKIEQERLNLDDYGRGIDGNKTSRKLNDSCIRLGIAFDEEDAHDGLYDCKKTFELYMAQQVVIKEASKIELGDYLAKLNPRQQLAATAYEGNNLVIAGPGTGKTHTLVYRLVHMYVSGVDMSKVVLITFTRKAAAELNHRVHTILPGVKVGFIGTFHGYANYLFTMNAKNHEYRLIDSEDDAIFIEYLMDEAKYKLVDVSGKKVTTKQIINAMSYHVNTKCGIAAAFIKTSGKVFEKGQLETFEAFYQKYRRAKFENKVLNYDDILVMIVKGVEKFNFNCDYLLVDEFQDTNLLNFELMQAIKATHTTVVGDDFQGIYGFRGATPQMILDFEDLYPNVKVITLNQNYRSTSNIVSHVNQVIDSVEWGYKKDLLPVRNDINPMVNAYNEQGGESIGAFIECCQVHPNDTTALIFRASNDKKEYEAELLKRHMDYVVYGGIKLLERKHIKDMLAIALFMTKRADQLTLMRLFKLFPGIGAVKARKYLDGELDYMEHADIAKLANMLAEYDQTDSKLVIQTAINYYVKYFRERTLNPEEIEDMDGDFKLVLSLCDAYPKLAQFYNELILDASFDSKDLHKDPKIILTTIHSAKGLEFDHVYVIQKFTSWMTYDEESLRLFYVAISRAKTHLNLIYSAPFDQNFYQILRYLNKRINEN